MASEFMNITFFRSCMSSVTTMRGHDRAPCCVRGPREMRRESRPSEGALRPRLRPLATVAHQAHVTGPEDQAPAVPGQQVRPVARCAAAA